MGRARAASIVLVLALVGALGVVAPAAGQTVAHPCAAATERCDGQIEVPLDWSEPGSERISVAFAWVPRTDTSRPAEGTILANPGGPSAALTAVELFEQALGPVLTRQNLLVVEPRGLGRSDALTCPGLDLARPATVEACAAQLGPRVRFFSADQAVTDMAAVARALEVDEVTFYGNSYGTLFGQAFATRHPERTGAVFLDSVVYTRPDGYTNGLTAGQAIRAGVAMMDVVCEPSRPCRALPGRGRDRWARVLEVLRVRPDSQVGWLQLMQMTAFVDDAVIGREVNAAAAAYLRGDEAPLRRLSQGLATALPPDDSELLAPEFAGTLAYVCADSAFPFDRKASTERRLRQLERHYATEQPYWPFTVEEALGVFGGDYPEWCARWPTPRPSPPVPPGAAYPAVPTLVVNGELDTTTPPWDAAAIAARFGRSTFVNVRFGTHAGGFGLWGPYSECVRDAMRSFIARPRHPVADPGCSGENYRALGRFPRTAREIPPAVGVRGSGGRLVAAAFATAADVLARRNPYASLMAGLTEEPGLRGGQVRFDDQAQTIQLDGVRFVRDIAVSGRIRWDGDAATADLTLSAGKSGRRNLRFGWTPFRAEDVTRVAGTLDGRRFVAWARAG